ncbi:hypothetical protein F4810DRAFT_714720 [Camillea tinctor]|nr:hypothetical protein F4810DRAFT_714720 [Camillea tinctor]
MPGPKSDVDPSTTPFPSSYWLIVGGIGPPPSSWASFLRLASERKAAYREAIAWSEQRAVVRAEWKTEEEEWNKRKSRPRRCKELMDRFGPQGTERQRGDDAPRRGRGTRGSSGNGSGAPSGSAGGGGGNPPDNNEGSNDADQPGQTGDAGAATEQ